MRFPSPDTKLFLSITILLTAVFSVIVFLLLLSESDVFAVSTWPNLVSAL